uniref:Reverse transcriptase Ty1/copia-type domain-containing protein n=1 Tax=Physcomitrium patens TaxID=3218 RepID=A0A2K1KIY2_PHYPA|nr:hypothetical protein PHYPA_007412 [Physcomitrium patens]
MTNFLAKRAAYNKYQIDHLDMKTTFLYMHFKKEVYIDQLLGLVQLNSNYFICKFNKSLYKLKYIKVNGG